MLSFKEGKKEGKARGREGASEGGKEWENTAVRQGPPVLGSGRKAKPLMSPEPGMG